MLESACRCVGLRTFGASFGATHRDRPMPSMPLARKLPRHALTVAIALLLPAQAAFAQDAQTAAPAESQAKTLDAVQVTAQRKVENLQDVPVSVTTINKIGRASW